MEGDLKIRSFADLNSWKEGHKLAVEIYKTTESFPAKEQFGLTIAKGGCIGDLKYCRGF